jgi:hypothetical protein
MTSNGRAGLGRIVLAFGVAGFIALAGCDKGPDRAEVAAQLKADVENQLKLTEGSAGSKVLSHTAVTVTPQDDDLYLVAIEGVKVEPAPDGYLEVGTVSYLAKPRDEKSYEISGLKVAETMPFKGPDGTERGKLTLTTKAFSGVWSRELGTLEKLDAEFADVAATDDQGGDVRVANLKVNGGLTDKGDGLFDSAGHVVLSGFAAKDTENGVFTISESRLDAKYDSIKLQEYQAAVAKYQELLTKQLVSLEQASGTTGQPPALTPEEEKAMADAVAAMAKAIKGGDFKLALNGLKYTEGSKEPFSLAAFNLGSAIDGINQPKATLGFDLAYQDLVVADEDMAGPVQQASLPKTGNFGFKITDIPGQDLMKVLTDNLPGMMSADQAMAQANAMAMLVAVQAVFQTSGAKIEVTPSELAAQLVNLKADGNFNVTPQAMWGVVGALNVAITGVDDLMALAQQTPDDHHAQQAIGTIEMLKQYSAREQGADGKPVDKFKVEVDESGQVLVNGKPM